MATLTSFSVLLDNEGEIIIAYSSTYYYIFYFVLSPWFHAGYGSPGIPTLIFFTPSEFISM